MNRAYVLPGKEHDDYLPVVQAQGLRNPYAVASPYRSTRCCDAMSCTNVGCAATSTGQISCCIANSSRIPKTILVHFCGSSSSLGWTIK
eukprot:1482527-Rhodomonas_salina.3